MGKGKPSSPTSNRTLQGTSLGTANGVQHRPLLAWKGYRAGLAPQAPAMCISAVRHEPRQSHVPGGQGPAFWSINLSWWKKHFFYIKISCIWACNELEHNFLKRLNKIIHLRQPLWICPQNSTHIFAPFCCQEYFGERIWAVRGQGKGGQKQVRRDSKACAD